MEANESTIAGVAAAEVARTPNLGVPEVLTQFLSPELALPAAVVEYYVYSTENSSYLAKVARSVQQRSHFLLSVSIPRVSKKGAHVSDRRS